jgi:hypothetical protein
MHYEEARETVRKFKRAAALTLTAAAMLAGSVGVSSPANAASSPIAACGGGSYHEIDHHTLASSTIYLMYNGSTDCVVTWKTAYVGTPTEVQASIWRQSDGKFVSDVGLYSTYAGPVKVTAPGTCINWGGGETHYTYWYAGWSHCG